MGEGATHFLLPSFYSLFLYLAIYLLITLMVLESLLLAITTRTSGELKGENNNAY